MCRGTQFGNQVPIGLMSLESCRVGYENDDYANMLCNKVSYGEPKSKKRVSSCARLCFIFELMNLLFSLKYNYLNITSTLEIMQRSALKH